MKITTQNPATEAVLSEYSLHTAAEIAFLVQTAHGAFGTWRRKSIAERMVSVGALAQVLRQHQTEIATLITTEMGKHLRESLAEVEKCAAACAYYAQHAAQWLTPPPTDVPQAHLVYQPLGVILGIMPWNFPMWQAIRAAVPAIISGNTFLLKHSPNTTGCALLLQRLFAEAGFPAGVFQTLLVDIPEIENIIADARIAGVTLTGSTRAGRAVAAAAGKALKPCVLELGGSDPYLLFADADIDRAVEAIFNGRIRNAGQSCIAAKRVITLPEIHETAVAKLTARFSAVSFGNPLDAAHEIGCMARHDLRENLHRQVLQSIEMGAVAHFGAFIPEGRGWFYPPTILTGITPEMPAYSEELFGPVVSVIAATDEADALRIANDTPYGLGAAIFSRDVAKAMALADEFLEAGSCFVNDFVRSDVRLPFGGIRESGFGRELGAQGLLSFLNLKTVWVA